MNIKTFGTVLLISTMVAQLLALALTYSLWFKMGVKGLMLGYVLSLAIFMALFAGLHKVTITDDNGIVKVFGDLADLVSMMAWTVTAILVITVGGAVIGGKMASDRGLSVLLAVFASVITTGLLFGSLAVTNKIYK